MCCCFRHVASGRPYPATLSVFWALRNISTFQTDKTLSSQAFLMTPCGGGKAEGYICLLNRALFSI